MGWHAILMKSGSWSIRSCMDQRSKAEDPNGNPCSLARRKKSRSPCSVVGMFLPCLLSACQYWVFTQKVNWSVLGMVAKINAIRSASFRWMFAGMSSTNFMAFARARTCRAVCRHRRRSRQHQQGAALRVPWKQPWCVGAGCRRWTGRLAHLLHFQNRLFGGAFWDSCVG